MSSVDYIVLKLLTILQEGIIMANLKLTTYQTLLPINETITAIESLPIANDYVLSNRLVALYGTNACKIKMQEVKLKDLKDNTYSQQISFIVKSGEYSAQQIDLSSLKKSLFLNTKRIKVELSNYLLSVLKTATKSELNDIDAIINDNPQLAFDILWSHEDFKHLNVISWQAPATNLLPFQKISYAVIRELSVIDDIIILAYNGKWPEFSKELY